MDTKLKNNNIMRRIAVILIVVMTFVWTGGLSVGLLSVCWLSKNVTDDYKKSVAFSNEVYAFLAYGMTSVEVRRDGTDSDSYASVMKEAEQMAGLEKNMPGSLRLRWDNIFDSLRGACISDASELESAILRFDRDDGVAYYDYAETAPYEDIQSEDEPMTVSPAFFYETEEGATTALNTENSVENEIIHGEAEWISKYSRFAADIMNETGLPFDGLSPENIEEHFSGGTYISYMPDMSSFFSDDVIFLLIDEKNGYALSNRSIGAESPLEYSELGIHQYALQECGKDNVLAFAERVKNYAKTNECEYLYVLDNGAEVSGAVTDNREYPYSQLFSLYNSYRSLLNQAKDRKVSAYLAVMNSDSILDPSNSFLNIRTCFRFTPDRPAVLLYFSASAFVCCLVLAVYVFVTTKRKQYPDGKYHGLDKLYNDWHFILFAAVEVLTVVAVIAAAEYFDDGEAAVFSILSASAAFSAGLLAAFEYLVSVIRNVSDGTLVSHSFWYVVIGKIRGLFSTKLLIVRRRVIVYLIAFFVFNALLLIPAVLINEPEVTAFIILIDILLVAVGVIAAIRYVRNTDRIFSGIYRTANGDTAAKLDVGSFPVHMRGTAESVNRINDGIRTAVEQAVKDENTKLELITNVSHDLKTPLTSIITYTDLLSMCNVTNPTEKEYIDILREKSARLKVLIDDLVEASKAGTGNVKVEAVRLNLYETVLQISGEYEDKLRNMGLELVINKPKEDVIVSADGRHTARILENLYSNVCKYTLPNTRVYVNVGIDGGFGCVTVKNISSRPLNMNGEELMQRFVRGDESRSGEGSGLGLSIVRSLADVQNGRFEIIIDGDMFTAVLRLPEA